MSAGPWDHSALRSNAENFANESAHGLFVRNVHKHRPYLLYTILSFGCSLLFGAANRSSLNDSGAMLTAAGSFLGGISAVVASLFAVVQWLHTRHSPGSVAARKVDDLAKQFKQLIDSFDQHSRNVEQQHRAVHSLFESQGRLIEDQTRRLTRVADDHERVVNGLRQVRRQVRDFGVSIEEIRLEVRSGRAGPAGGSVTPEEHS